MADDSSENLLRNRPERRVTPRLFLLGDVVRLRSGPSASFEGRVEGVNPAESLLKVSVETLGRAKFQKFGLGEVEKSFRALTRV